jgi:hypothetical protein
LATKTNSADVEAANVETTETVNTATFTKEQLLSAKKYFNRKDILGVLLDDGKEYTIEQVDTLVDEFMKGKVN